MISLAAHSPSIRAGRMRLRSIPAAHGNIGAAKCCGERRKSALQMPPCHSDPPIPPPRLAGSNSSAVERLVLLLTGVLCVDECAGLTAQCAYLIEAVLLSRRVSLPPTHLARVFFRGSEENVPLGLTLQPPHSLSQRLMELPHNAH